MSAGQISASFVMPRVVRLAGFTSGGSLQAVAVSAATGQTHPVDIRRSADDAGSGIDLCLPVAAFQDSPDRLEIRLTSETAAPLTLSVAVGSDRHAGALDVVKSSILIGWCSHLAPGRTIDLAALELLVDGTRQDVAALSCMRPDLKAASFQGGKDGFGFIMPAKLFDGEMHAVAVRYRGEGLASSTFQFALEVLGLEREEDRLAIRARTIGTAIADLELALSAALHQFSTTKAVAGTGPGEIEFAFDLPPLHDRVLCELAITPRFVPLAPLIRLGDHPLFAPRTAELRKLAGLVRSMPGLTDQDRRSFVDLWIAPRLATARSTPFAKNPSHAQPAAMPAVTIIVPVYDGVEATIACLSSLSASGLPADAAVMVVADCPPDPAMMQALRDYCGRFGFELRENERNLGFVATCNDAIGRTAPRDVVLLNSDTIVPPGWLQRIRSAAASAADIASATPFSNNATIMSYPLPDEASPLVPQEVQILDRLFADENAGVMVPIPTAVGFCMYMRRAAIDDIGIFDAIWDAGYGEENDWCMRAGDRGWRHVAAADVYVGHAGGVSFGATASARMRRNGILLEHRFPDYRRLIQDHIAADPLWRSRLAVDFARLAAQPQPTVLHVEHGCGGGLEMHVDRLARLLAQRGVRSLRLRPRVSPNEEPGYRIICDTPPVDMRFPSAELGHVLSRLQATGLTDVHIHSILNLPPDDAERLTSLGLPVTMTFHDYGVICPRVTLVGQSGRYCGEPEIDVCESCVKKLGPHPAAADFATSYGSVSAWRRHANKILARAERLTAPSLDCATRLSSYMPLARIDVVGGMEDSATADIRRRRQGERMRIGVLGAISKDKGLNELKAVVRLAAQRGEAIDFVIIGFTSDDAGILALATPLTTVTVTGRYEHSEVSRLLGEARLDYGFLPSVAPETFCYALSELWAAGVPVLAFDLGAQAERIRATGAGVLVDRSASPEAVLDALLSAIRQKEELPSSFHEPAPAASVIDGYAGARRLSQMGTARAQDSALS